MKTLTAVITFLVVAAVLAAFPHQQWHQTPTEAPPTGCKACHD